MFSRLVLVALLSVASADSQVSPTSAPTSVPTSAPTSGPEEPITQPTQDGNGESNNQNTGNNTDNQDNQNNQNDQTSQDNQTTTTTTADSTQPQAAKTTFTAALKLQAAADFDESKYLQALAKAAKVDAANVKVISVDYTVKAQYRFADDVTAEDVKAAVAKQLSVSADKVNATIASVAARRLREGRRLAVTADVTISVDSATAADAALVGLNNTAALATEMSVTAPTIVSSGVTVSVVSEITSTTGSPVEAPQEADVASEMSTLIGKPVEVEIKDVEKTEASTSPGGTELSGAPAKALAAPIALLVLAVSSLL